MCTMNKYYGSIVISVFGIALLRSTRAEGMRKRRRNLQGMFEVTAFGEDLNRSDPRAPLTTYPNADAARDSFYALFDSVERESFEDFPLNLHFPIESFFESAGVATLTGSQSAMVSETFANPHLRHATEGRQFLDVNANDDFFLTMEQPIAGFGFYATDIGDVLGTLTIETSLNGGNIKRYTVPHTVERGPTGADGNVIYAGILDTDGFDMIRFDLEQGDRMDGDFFGFDDFSVMSFDQLEEDNPQIPPFTPPVAAPSLVPPSMPTDPATPPNMMPSVMTPSMTEPSITPPSVTMPSVTPPSETMPSATPPSMAEPSIAPPSMAQPSVMTPSVTEPSIVPPSIFGPTPGDEGNMPVDSPPSNMQGPDNMPPFIGPPVFFPPTVGGPGDRPVLETPSADISGDMPIFGMGMMASSSRDRSDSDDARGMMMKSSKSSSFSYDERARSPFSPKGKGKGKGLSSKAGKGKGKGKGYYYTSYRAYGGGKGKGKGDSLRQQERTTAGQSLFLPP